MVVVVVGDGACGGGLGGGMCEKQAKRERGKKVRAGQRTEQVPMYCTVPGPLAENSGRREVH